MRRKIIVLAIAILLICSFVYSQDTTIHSNGITVNGTLESTTGGIIFPDGTVQETAFDYLGEFCWEIPDGIGGREMLAKLAVSDIGDNHYILTGKSYKYTGGIGVPPELENVINGSGEVIDGTIRFIFHNSGMDNVAMWSGICHGTINNLSFNSPITTECIAHDYNYINSTIDTQYSTNTSTPVTCP